MRGSIDIDECSNLNYRAMTRSLLLLSFISFLIISCSSADTKNSGSPEGAFKEAQEYEEADRYEEAIQRYADLKNKFPYSQLALQAELKIADLHFKREAYIEAQTAYQLFKEMHPNHPQIDYVTYQLGLSYYNQLPDSVDRDLTLGRSAIVYFDETIRQYPASDYAKQAVSKRAEVVNKLAGKELYIAKFYLKRKDYLAALARYETVIKSYPGSSSESQALSGATICAQKNGEPNKARQYFSILSEKFPDSNEYKNAKKETNL